MQKNFSPVAGRAHKLIKFTKRNGEKEIGEWERKRYNQKGRLDFHQSVRMCMKSAIIRSRGGGGGGGAEGYGVVWEQL